MVMKTPKKTVFRSLLILVVCAVLTVTVHAVSEEATLPNSGTAAETAASETSVSASVPEPEEPALTARSDLPLTEYWSADSLAAEALRSYVAKVTNEEDRENFIPKEDRIAVFDMDGTLTCETFYTYYDTMMFIDYCSGPLAGNSWLSEKAKEELKNVAASITPEYKAGEELARNFARAYSGMTVQELYDYAVEFGKKETGSFQNMRYIDGFYLPMVELVQYLYENDFTIYVISGTERTITRAIVGNSPIRDYVTPNHVIGTDFEVKLAGYETVPSNMDYRYAEGDELVITGGFIQKNLNANKTIYIDREIGQRPVLAFGNSGSDTSMMNYAIINNRYPAEAYMIVADDAEREWGTQDWNEKSEQYAAAGYIPVSMKNDFARIYPEQITKAEVQYQSPKSEEEAAGKTEPETQETFRIAEAFPSWNPDSATLKELVDFVLDCRDESSPNYLAPADRIATFDMDGTILCEKAPIYFDWCLTMARVLDDPTFEATDEERDAMEQTREHAYTNGETFKPEGLSKDNLVSTAFAGMTPEAFRAYVVDFAEKTDAVGFEGMTYAQSFYKPMLEVIEFLKANDFDVWMVSACEREVVRALVERLNIPFDHVVATDVPYVASGKGDEAADAYNMGRDEVILLGTPLDPVECGKSGKPAAIAREIGKRPVLAFGNSSGDYSMLNYAEGNPNHVGMGFFIVCDDTEREYGSKEKAAGFYEEAEKQGWTAISMANDWATIYGEGVKKVGLPGYSRADVDYAASFPSWNPDSPSLKELVTFVSGCTDESSPNYLAPVERIATFDMDGTILCEKAPVYFDWCLTMHRVLDDPTFEATDEERDAMEQTREHAYTDGETFKPEGLTKDDLVSTAFAGMTPEAFRAYVVDFADHTEAIGFKGMTYGQSFYKPMLEVIEYLRANDFDVWMVSACEREVVRALVERLNIPFDHVVATDVPYVASGKGDEAADAYNMSKDEVIVLGTPLDKVECGKSGKPAAIAREIGRRPVLAFGNSTGDYSMLNYAEGNPNHEGMGFFIVCDDTEREYGSKEKAAVFYEEVEKQGWTGISMADDWATIYGEGVEKTGLPGAEEEELPDAA